VSNVCVVIVSGRLRVSVPLGVTTPPEDDVDTQENVATVVAFAASDERPATPPTAASTTVDATDFHATRDKILASIR
jgi:hypothetical protein